MTIVWSPHITVVMGQVNPGISIDIQSMHLLNNIANELAMTIAKKALMLQDIVLSYDITSTATDIAAQRTSSVPTASKESYIDYEYKLLSKYYYKALSAQLSRTGLTLADAYVGRNSNNLLTDKERRLIAGFITILQQHIDLSVNADLLTEGNKHIVNLERFFSIPSAPFYTVADLFLRQQLNNGFDGFGLYDVSSVAASIMKHKSDFVKYNMVSKNANNNVGFPLWKNYQFDRVEPRPTKLIGPLYTVGSLMAAQMAAQAEYLKPTVLTPQIVQGAVRLTIPGRLANNAVRVGTNAVKRMLSKAIVTDNRSDDADRATAVAGLQFAVPKSEAVFQLLRAHNQLNSSVYLSAVLEYLLAEILELAGEQARKDERSKLGTKDIEVGIQHDEELRLLFFDSLINRILSERQK